MWYLISTLNRYIAKNFLFWFFVIFFSTALIISLFEMIELTRRTLQHDISLSMLMQMSFLRLPRFLNDFLPSVVFFASLGCFVRLSQSQNIVVILSFGLSRLQFVGGVCVVVFFIGILNIVVADPIRAVTSKRIVFLEEKIFKKKPNSISLTESGLWLKENQQNSSSIIHAVSLNIFEKKITDVMIFSFKENGDIEKRIDAKSAILDDGYWVMDDVKITTEKKQEKMEVYKEPTLITIEQIQHSTAPPETISFFEMNSFIEVIKKSGLNPTRYLMVWHKQISKIGMMIAFVFLAASFCFLSTRSKHFSLVVSASVIFAFFIHFIEHISYAYGAAEKIPVIVASWAPSFITISCGYWLMVVTDDR